MSARLVDHTYHDGYGRRHLDQRYCVVQCDACGIILNSGHHYTDDARHHAERLRDEHNAAHHGDHDGHDVWLLVSRPGTAWCRTCQVHFESRYQPTNNPTEEQQ